jgi:hypothetical protein
MTCADYGTIFEHLHWTSWTPTSATAVGTLVYKTCEPNCADGGFGSVPDTEIMLNVARLGAGGRLVWSELEANHWPPGYATGPLHGGPSPLPISPE